MDRVFSILPRVLRQRGLSSAAFSGLILERASAWIRERLPEHASHLRPLQVKDGILTIEGGHSIAVMECSGCSEELLKYLADTMPDVPVKAVRVVRGR